MSDVSEIITDARRKREKFLNIREFQRFRDEERVVEVYRVGVCEARYEVCYRRFLIIRNGDEF